MLLGLKEHFDIFLGGFIDDPADVRYVSNVEELCVETKLLEINSRQRTVFSALGFLHGLPLSVVYYQSAEMQSWVNDTLRQHPEASVYVFSSAMGQFVPEQAQPRTVVDFVDVDSDKWRQYSVAKKFPMSWIYAREARTLLKFEQVLARSTAASTFVSTQEAQFFSKQVPDHADKVHAVSNGVDLSYFSSTASFKKLHLAGNPVVTFVGAMDYWANVDAVVWFAQQVMPLLTAQLSQIQFYIVGGNPTADVQRLAGPNVVVTGRVEDVRPYMECADVIVAPLRIARGIQNKVLEALAFAKPVVASSMAMEGINCSSVCVADSPIATADAIQQLLADSDRASALANDARTFVEENFAWSVFQDQMSQLQLAATKH